MSEKNNVISPELWAPLEQEEKNAEKMEKSVNTIFVKT